MVIRYSYLWLREHRQGQDEGSKDRPCAIILALTGSDDDKQVLVVPITHSPPETPEHAIELPLAVKRHLGLDGERSWIIYSESNLFAWPGPDIRRVAGRDDSSISYGFLPPRLFAELRRRFLDLEVTARRTRISRTE